MIARVCIIAGSDSGGGAGIQADIKTVTMLGGYATTAITALTAQNTLGVQEVLSVPDTFIAKQLTMILEDIGADTIKTGMLHTASVIRTISSVLDLYPTIPLIVDPVMVAKGGASLLQDDALVALKEHLLPRAFLLTPNIPEASLLASQPISSLADMLEVANILLTLGPQAVLLKGGHLEGETMYDVLVTDHHQQIFEAPHIHTNHTHGTGCTLASAISCLLAQHQPLPQAIAEARAYLQGALRHAPGLGHGHGPLHHGWCLPKTH